MAGVTGGIVGGIGMVGCILGAIVGGIGMVAMVGRLGRGSTGVTAGGIGRAGGTIPLGCILLREGAVGITKGLIIGVTAVENIDLEDCGGMAESGEDIGAVIDEMLPAVIDGS